MKIDDLNFDNPFVLAPMAGITDGPFRRLCREQGSSLVYSEMISAKGLFYKDKSTEKLLVVYEDELPIAFQLFGSEPEVMAYAAESLRERKNSMIDINMGCPVPKIVKNGEGSALMRNPELAAKIVEKVVSSAGKPVTVKIRIGWDAGSINAVEFAIMLEASGASAISVHGRTRDQYYSGKVDRKVISEVKNVLKIPVIANGDVYCGKDAVQLMDETGCDGVMIGRGALGNPWIFADALAEYRHDSGLTFESPSKQERIDMMIRHLDFLIEEKGEYVSVRSMRKHVAWYTKGMRDATSLRRKVNGIDDVKSLKEAIRAL